MQTLSCGMWDLVPQAGNEPGPLALRGLTFSHWTTRDVPAILFLSGMTSGFTFFKNQP